MLQAVSCFTVPRAIVVVPGRGWGPRSVVVAVVIEVVVETRLSARAGSGNLKLRGVMGAAGEEIDNVPAEATGVETAPLTVGCGGNTWRGPPVDAVDRESPDRAGAEETGVLVFCGCLGV